MSKCDWKCKCKKESRWEVGFSAIIHNDSSRFLCGDDVDYTQLFCDNHFIKLNGCGNVIEFRQIGTEKWLDFTDYDNYYILEKIVKRSRILYISNKIKIKKITNFLKIQ